MGIRRPRPFLVLWFVFQIFNAAFWSSIPVKAGRTTNGSTQYLQTTMPANGIFPAVFGTQAQGSIAFYLNLISIPAGSGSLPTCGVHCGEIVNVIAGHNAAVNGCLTTTGACLDIFVCNAATCGHSQNDIVVDITTPGVGEAETVWPVSTGLHQYVFLLNRTASNMKLYTDGVLQTISGFGQSSDPGDINYPAQNCGGQVCDLTLMASEGGTPSADNFANGTISDVGIWKSTLSVGEIKSLANCVPPNRIQPENLIYIPVYGVDSPEPVYTSQHTGTPAVIHPLSLTLTAAPTRALQQVGCQPGGAYR